MKKHSFLLVYFIIRMKYIIHIIKNMCSLFKLLVRLLVNSGLSVVMVLRKVINIFSTTWGIGAPNPTLFKCQLYIFLSPNI